MKKERYSFDPTAFSAPEGGTGPSEAGRQRQQGVPERRESGGENRGGPKRQSNRAVTVAIFCCIIAVLIILVILSNISTNDRVVSHPQSAAMAVPPASAPAAVQSAAAAPESPTAAPPSVIAGTDIKLQKDEIIDFIDKRLQANLWPYLALAKDADTAVTAADGTAYTLSRYVLIEGICFYFYTNPDTGDLYQFVFSVDEGRLAPEDYQLLSYLDGSLSFLLEPDTYESFGREIGLTSDNGGGDIDKTAAGAVRQYRYVKNKTVGCFYAAPAGRDILPLDLTAPGSPGPNPSSQPANS